MRYIGVDVGKSRCQACIMDKDGGILDEFPFINDGEGIKRLLDLARATRLRAERGIKARIPHRGRGRIRLQALEGIQLLHQEP